MRRNVMLSYYTTQYKSPVGPLTLACDGENLTGLWMEGQKYYGGAHPEALTPGEEYPVLAQTRQWLDRYFAGERPAIGELPLAPAGSPFRQMIWKLLCEIPYGQVTTYGELAAKAAKNMGRTTMSGQAVGGAVGHNPISIVIPCHRVVGASGSLTGYAGGISKKLCLLRHEGVEVERFTIPKKGTAL